MAVKGQRRSSFSALKPSHWPEGVRYISQQCYHPSVPQDLLSHLHPSHIKRTSTHTTPSHWPVVIRVITEDRHPAKGQRGLFAAKRIPPRTLVIDYVGEVHCDDRPDSNYDLSLYRTAEASVGVDASLAGNEARFVNDYRGIKRRPNAMFEEHRTESGELCMAVWSGVEGIKKGEEILVSYGKGFWHARTSELASI